MDIQDKTYASNRRSKRLDALDDSEKESDLDGEFAKEVENQIKMTSTVDDEED